MSEQSKTALNITYDQKRDLIVVEVLNPKRFTHYGFGTFLENVEPAEVTITREALDLLLEQPERRGLQGMEFWPDNRLAWGSPTHKFAVSPRDINVPSEAKKWMKKFTIVQK